MIPAMCLSGKGKTKETLKRLGVVRGWREERMNRTQRILGQ